jgi:hypothetical protein
MKRKRWDNVPRRLLEKGRKFDNVIREMEAGYDVTLHARTLCWGDCIW